jgi:uncharacterized protein YcbK (DUF882 family)
MKITDHFNSKEFDCQCGCGAGEISSDLVNKLEKIRVAYGHPMRINSGIRCLDHNRSIGSSDTSSHIIGLAADVGCTDMASRMNLIMLFGKHFKRMGIHKDFIHVDVDYDKPEGIFVY